MSKLQRNSFVNYSDTPCHLFFFSTVIYNLQKGLWQPDAWDKKKVTETQFSKGFPESRVLLPDIPAIDLLSLFKSKQKYNEKTHFHSRRKLGDSYLVHSWKTL